MTTSYILETKRFKLRELNAELDSKSFYQMNEDPEVLKYTGDTAFQDQGSAQKFLKNYDHYTKHGFGRWAVLNKNNEFIGWCGLKYSNELDEVDIGFRYFQKYWGNGIATEVGKAVLNYGHEQLKIKQIVGRVRNDNLGSVKVLQKIGMHLWKDFMFDQQFFGSYYLSER